MAFIWSSFSWSCVWSRSSHPWCEPGSAEAGPIGFRSIVPPRARAAAQLAAVLILMVCASNESFCPVGRGTLEARLLRASALESAGERDRRVRALLGKRGIAERVRVDVAQRGDDRFRHARMPLPDRVEQRADLAADALLLPAHAAHWRQAAGFDVRVRQRLAHEQERSDEPQRALPR